MNLRNCLSERVLIIDVDDKEWDGIVDYCDYAENNDDNEDIIAIKVPALNNIIVEFKHSEIRSIKVIQ